MQKATVVVATLVASLLMAGCKDATQETFNESDGAHEMYKAETSSYPFDRKMTFHIRWSACTWFVNVLDPGGKERTIQHGTETKSVYVPFVDGRRAWLHLESCGRVDVHR